MSVNASAAPVPAAKMTARSVPMAVTTTATHRHRREPGCAEDEA
ncbi:MAG TPA: hypothetical protein VGP93_11975 [Polyangiaceae bacterium]|nr:hypothetical protein [Polyangiaceae bacterium]